MKNVWVFYDNYFETVRIFATREKMVKEIIDNYFNVQINNLIEDNEQDSETYKALIHAKECFLEEIKNKNITCFTWVEYDKYYHDNFFPCVELITVEK